MPLLIALLPIFLLVVYFTPEPTPGAGAIPPEPTPPEPTPGAPELGADTLAALAELEIDPGAVALPYVAPDAVESVALASSVSIFDTFIAPLQVQLRKIFTLPPAAKPYADSIAAAESRYGIPDTLLARVLYEESRFRPDIISGAKVSSAGALGIAQFMPGTAADLGINPLDPHAAIDAAARYLKQQFDRFGDWAKALAAYSWGPARVAKKGIEAAPRETRRYVSAILSDVEP